MRYVSTRGNAPTLGFCDVILAGLARDGGLYVPETWPQFTSEEIHNFGNRHYEDVAFAVISRFVGDEIPADELMAMIKTAYQSFTHPSRTPLLELEPGHFVLELWHGPTLAFKDVAMQFLARVMDYILGQRGERATIIGATSGDTGSAAIEAFRGRANTDIFILHPNGRTSDIQRRQMTTVLEENVFNIAIEGTFDDCQTIVKGMFNNLAFRDAAKLSGVNSINWGRIVAQVVYYFTAAVALGAPHRKVTFVVPTGNFGDIFAGYVAKKMGLPVEKLVIATNSNDILRRAVKFGRYDKRGVIKTVSPSMDIEISSNFERLLFEALGRDGSKTAALLASLDQSGGFAIPESALSVMREEFGSGMADETATASIIADVFNQSKYLIDPHTAVGVAVARGFNFGHTPLISLSTAHPSKFPEVVEAATGIRPQLPRNLADLETREERYSVLANDRQAVEDFIRAKTRAWEE
jgi:threonine synthase